LEVNCVVSMSYNKIYSIDQDLCLTNLYDILIVINRHDI
jgi:hypothetical protein